MTIQPKRVEDAIDWAIRENVDLINMSLGFRDKSLPRKLWGLEDALKRAQQKGILVFAAASNSGNHYPVAWPARDVECAVCVHSCPDFGTTPSNFTPSGNNRTKNFMVVGENLYSYWPSSKGGGRRAMGGTSVATPVATAMVALVLAFMRQTVCENNRNDAEKTVRLERLKSLSGMSALLEKISRQVSGDYYWIHPELFWKDYHPAPEHKDDPNLAVEHAWNVIHTALRK